jgi:hypothetical protein
MNAQTQGINRDPISACTCFNCEADSPMAPTLAEAEAIAGGDGWVLGLDPDSEDVEANAVYACPACAEFLIAAHPVSPLDFVGDRDHG